MLKNILNNRRVLLMNIVFRTDAKNSNRTGYITIDSRMVFNFDGFKQEHTENEKEFLTELTTEWKEIPTELLDPTTAQNFNCYAKLPKEREI
jgi:hypothetical protein